MLPRWGVSEGDLRAHFGGPAFLAWQRMGNLHSYMGPLPFSFIQDQAGNCDAAPTPSHRLNSAPGSSRCLGKRWQKCLTVSYI